MSNAEKVAIANVARESGWLYYIDKKGNIARNIMLEDGQKKKRGSKPEIVAETNVIRDDNFIYFMDNNGDVARVPRSKSASKRAVSPSVDGVISFRSSSSPTASDDLHAWLEANDDAFYANEETKQRWLIHRAECWHLGHGSGSDSTKKAKHCATRVGLLRAFATSSGATARACSNCTPADDAEAVDDIDGEDVEIVVDSDSEAQEARERVLRSIALRRGQARFRATLIEAYEGRCAMTGNACVEILEAADIERFADGGNNTASNGLLLRADVHTLFDLGLISVDDAGCIHVATRIRGHDEYGRLHGTPLRRPLAPASWPNTDLLGHHHRRCEP